MTTLRRHHRGCWAKWVKNRGGPGQTAGAGYLRQEESETVVAVTHSLHRGLRASGTVVLGLAAMLGAGVFTGLAPAAAQAGPWLLAALPLAAADQCAGIAEKDQAILGTRQCGP
jgi:hypothetical protein